MKKTALLIFLLTFSFNIFGQKVVTGAIYDSKTSEPMAFVNVAIVGTTVGTVSDEFGEFSLSIPANLCNKLLQFSSVGYLSYSQEVSQINQPLEVKLEPTDYKIGEVVVKDKSAAGVKVLKSVVAELENNYISSPYSLKGNYVFSCSDVHATQKTSVSVDFYDCVGYLQSARKTAYDDRNYSVKVVWRQKPAIDYWYGRIAIEEILTTDIVRSAFNILDAARYNDYEITLLQSGDGVNKLTFKCSIPTFYHCGYENPKEYYGVLNVKNNVIISGEYTVVCVDKKVDAQFTYSAFGGKNCLTSASVKITSQFGEESHVFNAESISNGKQITGKVFFCR